MKFVEDKVKYIEQRPGIDGMFKMMERAARICYKTEDRIGEGTAEKIINSTIIPLGHTSVLEFGTVYLKFNILQIGKYLKYVFDRYSRVKWNKLNMYVTTTYRTIMQGDYKDPVDSIEHNFDKDWKKDLEYWSEPTKYHHKRYCFHFVMDRVGSQSVMRHRGNWGISYAQESTRFVNYSNKKFDGDIQISLPSKFYEIVENLQKEREIEKKNKKYETTNLNDLSLEDRLAYVRKHSDDWNEYEKALKQSEKSYMKLVGEYRWKPQDARGALNFDVKTEFLMCAYKPDWKMWLFRRLDKHAHPHIQWFANKINDFFSNNNSY